jgi:hypothetical protein
MMQRFFKKVGIIALILVFSFFFLVLPFLFFLPYDEEEYLRAFLIKEKMLVEHDRPTIFLQGGSSLSFGFDSEQLEEALHLPVVNLGLLAGLGLKFMIDDVVPHLEQGDILILSPEYGIFSYRACYGSEALADIFYISRGKILPLLCWEEGESIMDGTTHSVVQRIIKLLGTSKDDPFVHKLSWFNRHGDIVGHKNLPSVPFFHTSALQPPYPVFLDYFCQRIEELRQKGVTVLLFPPPLTETSFKNIQKYLPPLIQALEERNIPFVLPPKDFVFPDSLFFDTENHLNYQGTLLRTQKVIDRLTTLQIF